MEAAPSDFQQSRTRIAFVWSRILKTPFWSLYDMLPFILLRDLNATTLQIAIIVALKPTSSLFSLYWSASISRRPDRLVSNIMWATVVGLLPFFFFPFVNNPWFFIFAFGFYMVLHRGVIPAWMEVIKLNLPKVAREKVFANGATYGYLGDGIFPFLLGGLLDGYFQSWRWIFPITASISMAAIYFQLRIPIQIEKISETQLLQKIPLITKLTTPWKNVWNLIKSRVDFRHFQVGFMLGGGGLVLMHGVLPQFFMSVLDLSYTALAVARMLCKGIGFALSSQLWARWMNKVDIYRVSSLVTLTASLFPLCLLFAQHHIAWVYIAYFVYGIMQGGSELSWHMSGPIFSKNEDSSLYSSVNVAMVGLRGCIAPGLGAFLGWWTDSTTVLLIGGGICLLGSVFMNRFSARYRLEEPASA
ncbi:MAG TPA: MFS transporter [Waddliaceae bacterium]